MKSVGAGLGSGAKIPGSAADKLCLDAETRREQRQHCCAQDLPCGCTVCEF
jgi:hypothetical protein